MFSWMCCACPASSEEDFHPPLPFARSCFSSATASSSTAPTLQAQTAHVFQPTCPGTHGTTLQRTFFCFSSLPGVTFGEMHKHPHPVESVLLVLEKVLPQCIPLHAYRGLSHRGSKLLSILYKNNNDISVILYPCLPSTQHCYSTFEGFANCYT